MARDNKIFYVATTKELRALGHLLKVFKSFNFRTRRRMIWWLAARFDDEETKQRKSLRRPAMARDCKRRTCSTRAHLARGVSHADAA